MIFNCPKPAALTSIPSSNCPFRLDQIVRLALRRTSNAAFSTDTALKTLATWTPLLAATDSTKIIMSPVFSGMVIPASEGTFVGGNDNSTVNGVREYYGEGPVTVTGNFKNVLPAALAAMDLLAQESLANALALSDLELFFINRFGFIFSANLDGVNAFNFRVASRGSEGFNTPDIIPFSFDLQAGWDRTLMASKPTFDPLVDLVNP